MLTHSFVATRVRLTIGLLLAVATFVSASSQVKVGTTSTGPPPPSPPSDRSSAVPVPRTAAISGVVVDGSTGSPVAGALVFLSSNGYQAVGLQSRQLTDELGRFAFVNLAPARTYSIAASKPGYRDSAFGHADYRDGPSAPIAVLEGEWFSRARITLSRPASVSGIVTDERGEPVVNAYVRVLGKASIAGNPHLVAGPLTTTDDRGAYRIGALAPGQYIVQVPSVQSAAPLTLSTTELAGLSPQALAAYQSSGRTPVAELSFGFDATAQIALGRYATPPPPVDGRWQAYPITFFPGALALAQATVLDLRAGDDRTADLRLTPVPTGRVRGFVQGPPESLFNLTLRLLPAGLEDLGLGGEAATTLVQSDGSFTFLGVPAGTYTIDAPRVVTELSAVRFSVGPATGPALPRQLGFGGSSMTASDVESAPAGTNVVVRDNRPSAGPYWGRSAVVTDGSDLSGVVVAMRPAATMTGRTVIEADPRQSASAPQFLSLFLEPADGSPRLGRPPDSVAERTPERNFSIQNIGPGSYVLRMQTSAGWLVKSVTWNGRDYAEIPFDAAATRDFSDVLVTVTNAVPTLTGAVRDGQGATADSAVVMAFPVEPESWAGYGFTPRRIKTTSTSNTGMFEFKTLPAGEYFLLAVPPSQRRAWQNPDYLRRMAATATRVRVDWGETTSQDLRLAGQNK
jgi:hypothetical protein